MNWHKNDRNYYTDGSYIGTSRTFVIHISFKKHISCGEAERVFDRMLQNGEIRYV